MTPKRERQLGLSATTFLLLCVAWGPHRACFVIAVAAILTCGSRSAARSRSSGCSPSWCSAISSPGAVGDDTRAALRRCAPRNLRAPSPCDAAGRASCLTGRAARRDRRRSDRERKTSIDLASYVLTDRLVIAALDAAERRGVKVRMVLDPREHHDFVDFGDLSDNVKIKRGGPLMHLKAYEVGRRNLTHRLGQLHRLRRDRTGQ
jgi:hypothetical protein